MSQALRKLTGNIRRSNTICVFINQIREKIGVMFGNPETTSGGNALKFYASVRLDIRRIATIKEGENGRQPGAGEGREEQGRASVQAGRVRHPLRRGHLARRQLLNLGVNQEIVEKSGTWFSFDGERLGQGHERDAEAASPSRRTPTSPTPSRSRSAPRPACR